MNEFIINSLDEILQNYLENHIKDQPKWLDDLEEETWQKMLQPHIISGHYQGRLLSLISKIIQPKCILEIGTYTGYSTLCLAEGLDKDGLIHTIDINQELFDLQEKYWKQSPYLNQIKSYIGPALDIIPKIEAEFDLVFIDADKINYINYFHAVIDNIRPKGIIISDNVLWKGKVLKPDKKDKVTQLLIKYNQLIAQDKRIESVILPIRDGISLARVI